MRIVLDKYSGDNLMKPKSHGSLICGRCKSTTYKLLTNPTGELNSKRQKELICEDCEYEISCTLDSMNDEPIKKYKDRRG